MWLAPVYIFRPPTSYLNLFLGILSHHLPMKSMKISVLSQKEKISQTPGLEFPCLNFLPIVYQISKVGLVHEQ